MSPVIEFVRCLDVTLGEVVAGLVATYLHGSAALGAFVTGRSDVDVLVVCHDEPLHPDELTAAAGALRAAAAPCPGRGLELSMVARRHALHPGPPWPFLLHVTTDPDDDTTVLEAQHPGDPDLVMHYVACRAVGIVVRGPPPAELVGEVARVDVLGYLEVELRWAPDDAPEAYGVLNACRALAYLDEGKILAKADGARYALDHGVPHELITAALAMQLGDQPQRHRRSRPGAFSARSGASFTPNSSDAIEPAAFGDASADDLRQAGSRASGCRDGAAGPPVCRQGCRPLTTRAGRPRHRDNGRRSRRRAYG